MGRNRNNTKLTKAKERHKKELSRLQDKLRGKNLELGRAYSNLRILIAIKDQYRKEHEEEFNEFVNELKAQKK